MKKNYNLKKKAVIITLSLLAVCLAGGLFYYINTTGKQPQEIAMENISPTQPEVAVPEIETSAEDTQSSDEDISVVIPSLEATEETPYEESEAVVESSAHETKTQEKQKPSDGKPKSPEQATPPAEPPTASETVPLIEETEDKTQSPTEPIPQPENNTGSPNAVYVPGFGYVEPSGAVEGSTSHTDGDWNKQIGEMQ